MESHEFTLDQAFANDFRQVLKKEEEGLIEGLCWGAATDYGEYSNLSGKVQQIRKIKQEFDRLYSNYFTPYREYE